MLMGRCLGIALNSPIDDKHIPSQALHKDIKTWVHPPQISLGESWAAKFSDPVVQRILAL